MNNPFALLGDGDAAPAKAAPVAAAAPAKAAPQQKQSRDNEPSGDGNYRGANPGQRRDGGRGRGGEGRTGRGGRPRRDGEGEFKPRNREFDRKSGTGRGTEMKRGGAGRGNWGESTEDGSAAPAADGEGAEAAEPVVEEPDNEIGLVDYEKQQAEKKAALAAKFGNSGSKAAVDTSAFKGMSVSAKSGLDDSLETFLVDNTGKKFKDNSRKGKQVIIGNFKSAEPARDSGKGGKGGKGPRGSAGGRGKRDGGSAPRIDDASAFPTLG